IFPLDTVGAAVGPRIVLGFLAFYPPAGLGGFGADAAGGIEPFAVGGRLGIFPALAQLVIHGEVGLGAGGFFLVIVFAHRLLLFPSSLGQAALKAHNESRHVFQRTVTKLSHSVKQNLIDWAQAWVVKTINEGANHE